MKQHEFVYLIMEVVFFGTVVCGFLSAFLWFMAP